jgi:signal transduction histidine kinase
MIKNKNFKQHTIIYITLLSITIIAMSYFIIKLKTTHIKETIFNNQTLKIKQQTKFLIKNKQKETLALSLVLSKDRYILKALKNKEHTTLKLANLTKTLNIFTNFKNVWFHIINKNGNSFYRSWSKINGDNILKARADIREILKTKKVISTISVGKFDITFKCVVPIIGEDDNFLGIFETITHFNSIAKNLEKNQYDILVLADKKYKKQLTKSITKTFIDNYYVSNLDAKKNIISKIKDIGIDNIIKNKTYLLDTKHNLYITKYNIKDNNAKNIGYIIVIKPLDEFDLSEITNIQRNIILLTILIIILLIGLGYYLITKQHKNILTQHLLQTQKDKKIIDSILSAQPYIIILLYDKEIDYANNLFFEFFNNYKNLDEFKKEHKDISDFFITSSDADDDSYIDKDINWLENINQKSEHEHKVIMSNGTKQRDFIIKAVQPKIDSVQSVFTVLTLIDITDMKEKDALLFERSKMASMGEMIGNIAHQWRQPLSVISTSATGMQMMKEFDNLSDESFNKSCDIISENVQFLSKTIDDFRNFIKGNQLKEHFILDDLIDKFSHLIEPVSKAHNITVVYDTQKDIKLYSYQNELIHCFINIFNNAKDALEDKKDIEKLFFIKIKQKNNNVKIELKDNGGGIDDKIINKIFEPYFTTKHKSQGTGIGLHMTYNIITQNIKGTILASNQTYTYNNKTYTGAVFNITLPNNLS